ncbi:MAG: hypothetical protein A2V90_08080 [Gammaproteobacteria bacterium RBG_16_57_12]|nr:MAG: hypothetical protein A2V90_08080 [Gammaproteobacteria bacterium RBG_16_57_12]
MSNRDSNPRRAFYLGLIFWVGFSALVYEIYSVKVLFLFFTETTHAVTLAISAFLAGLAGSSLIFSRIARGYGNNPRLVMWMQLAAAAYGYLILANYDLIPHLMDALSRVVQHEVLNNLLRGAMIWIYLFIPAFFIGGAFPLVNGLYLGSHESGTHDTGTVYFWDTLGSIIGTFCAGFWLLPTLGFRLTAISAVAINLLVVLMLAQGRVWRGAVIVIIAAIGMAEWQTYRAPGQHAGTASTTKTVAGLAPIAGALETPLPPLAPQYPDLDDRFGHVIFQEMSPFGRVTVGMHARQIPGNKGLFINYREMCHSIEHESEMQLGWQTVKHLTAGARVLNIGLGCGYTASRIAQSPHVARLDIVEINPVVARAAGEYFAQENQGVLTLPKTNLIIQDGAEYVRTTSERYHAVVIDIEEVSIIYSSPLYSREYLEIIRQKLLPGGAVAVWAQTGSLEFEKTVYNTLKSVFRHVYPKIDDTLYSFHASDIELDITPSSAREQWQIEQLLKTPVDEINTLDNHALEKYFNIREFFNLPYDYRERFLRGEGDRK